MLLEDVSVTDGSHQRVHILCDFGVSDKCRGEYLSVYKDVIRYRQNNNGKDICLYCSRSLKFSGRNNPNCLYKNLDDNFLTEIDTEGKAYVLGWVASDGTVTEHSVTIEILEKDIGVMYQLQRIIGGDLPLNFYKRQFKKYVSIIVNSTQWVKDVCRHLRIKPGKKSHTVVFPSLSDETLLWAFTRGVFDGDGHIRRPDGGKHTTPECDVAGSSKMMLEPMADFVGLHHHLRDGRLNWSGVNAMDFLGKIYDGAKYRLPRKYDTYLDWCCWCPAIAGGVRGRDQFVKWATTRKDAVPPYKGSPNDIGWDLTLVEKVKQVGCVSMFDTGIKVQPSHGYYVQLVPRSSIYKTGYMLTNSIGIIDRHYIGNLLVPLMKVDNTMPDLQLPFRAVQMLPVPALNPQFVEVEQFEIEPTGRGSDGFGSTGH